MITKFISKNIIKDCKTYNKIRILMEHLHLIENYNYFVFHDVIYYDHYVIICDTQQKFFQIYY